MTEKVSLSVRKQISAENKAAMDAILETISKMNLKGYGLTLPPEVEVQTTMS